MSKQAIACLLIATMTMLALTTPTLHTVRAEHHVISGENWGYWESVAEGSGPWYCECYHLVWDADPMDSEAGLSVIAGYTVVNGVPMFDWGWWFFESEAGGQDAMPLPCLAVDACVNHWDHHYYAYYATPQYSIPPLASYYCWNIWLSAQGHISPVYSEEGRTTAYFYDNYCPWLTWHIEAYTQNPPGQQGNGWSYLTAHW